jgi:hypothetical protein
VTAIAAQPFLQQARVGGWHQRYGGAGIMVYWHVERRSVCIYSQVTSTSASEVASMIEGLLRHLTSAEIDRQYVDTHGASIVGFAFSHLLDFQLLPRLKNIGSARLCRPGVREDESWPQLWVRAGRCRIRSSPTSRPTARTSTSSVITVDVEAELADLDSTAPPPAASASVGPPWSPHPLLIWVRRRWMKARSAGPGSSCRAVW